MLEELDAWYDRKVLMAMYQLATANKHDFWYEIYYLTLSKCFKNMTPRMVVN